MNKEIVKKFPGRETLEIALDNAIKTLDIDIERFGDKYPQGWTSDGRYPLLGCENWMSGFWPGMLWLAYERTGDEKYRKLGDKKIDEFYERIETKSNVGNHDLGFLYSLSCVSAYKLTGNEKAKKAALMAADHLCKRFVKKGDFINAWASVEHLSNDSNFLIIDCLMNVPLLRWASEVTGDGRYADIAERHTSTTAKLILREDGSTYHKYHFDVETGKPAFGGTVQGYSDSSCWSRGQAWGIYGFALAYSQTGDKKYIECFRRVTDYFCDRLPEDYIAYWDLFFTEGDEPRDTSAAVIAACGILEAADSMDKSDEKMDKYLDICAKITKSLIEKYALAPDGKNDGLISEGTADMRGKLCRHSLVFGDYYYMELLTRLLCDWRRYW